MNRSALLTEILAIASRASRHLLLVGEPGIGKSTLMLTATENLTAAGFTVLRAAPSSAERYTPYSVVADLFSTVDHSSIRVDPRHEALFEILAGDEPAFRVAPTLAAAIALESVLTELARTSAGSDLAGRRAVGRSRIHVDGGARLPA